MWSELGKILGIQKNQRHINLLVSTKIKIKKKKCKSKKFLIKSLSIMMLALLPAQFIFGQETLNTPPANTPGAQTRTTSSSQTTVGNTTVQMQDNGARVTSTPTVTVDRDVTTITTADSETIITETTTTTVTESLTEGPAVYVTGEGSSGSYATQAQQATQANQARQAQQATGYVSPYSPGNPYNPQTASSAGRAQQTELMTTSPSVVVPGASVPAQSRGLTSPSSVTSPTTIVISPAAQTTINNDTQTTVGETSTQIMDDGSTLTTTPTETIDTTVTTITAPNSETIITETITTTVIDGTLEHPAIVTGATRSASGGGASTGSGASSATTETGNTLITVSEPDDITSGAGMSSGESDIDNSGMSAADVSKTAATENGSSETLQSEEETEITDSSSPSSVLEDETSSSSSDTSSYSPSSSGTSNVEHEAEAARRAELARIQREEDIQRQREAAANREGSQQRAMQLLEGQSPAMISNGMTINNSDMADPQRMSIFSQNMRLRSQTTPNVSGQISNLANILTAATIGLDGGTDNIFAPCPPILANACDEAANRAADDIEEGADKAKDKGKKNVEEDLDELDDEIDDAQEKADDEKDRRDKRSRRERLRDRLEDDQRDRAEDLEEEGDDLEERANEQQERRERLEQEERDLRRQEQEARRRGDPNCRGAECRSIRDQRRQNSRDTTKLVREEGVLQRDQARFQGQVREFQQHQREIDALWQGDPVWEARQAQAGAHERANEAQGEVERLREEQLDLRRRGGSGSRQDRAFDRAIANAERIAGAATREASASDMTVLQAEFYDNGMRDEWKEYENARRAGDTYNDFIGADQQVRDLFERRNNVEDAIRAAQQDPEFDADSLRSMEEDLGDLNRQLNDADVARQGFQNALGDYPEFTGQGGMRPGNDTGRAISDTLTDLSSQFGERQRLRSLSDAELDAEIGMLNEAEQRVASARAGLGGELQDPGGPYTDRYNTLQDQKDQLQERVDNFNPTGVDGRPLIGADQAFRDLQNQLDDVNDELGTMTSIAAADSAFDRVETFNEWSDGLLDGFPLDNDGGINRSAFSDQVAEMAQRQINLVQASGNLEGANADLQQAQASGDDAAIRRAMSRVEQYNDVVGRITNQFELDDVNVLVNENGEFAVETETVGASATWSAAAAGVSDFMARGQAAQKQYAAAGAGTTPPATADVAVDSSTSTGRVGEGTVLRDVSEPVIPTEPPLEAPGGYFGSVIRAAQAVADQANAAAASSAARSTKPRKSIAELATETLEKTQEVKESQAQANRVERDIDSAEFEVEMAESEATFRRKLIKDNLATRQRQAGEYVELADSATSQADKQRDRAADLDAQAERLREAAARNQRIADTTDDRSLARDANAAAQDNLQNAKERQEQADEIRTGAARDDARASSLNESGERVLEDAEQLKQDAAQADADAKRAQADLDRLEAEAERLNVQTERLRTEAAQSATKLAQTQQRAFVNLLKDPPDGWRWSALDSSQRNSWLNDNIPQWDNLSQSQKEDYLYRLELGEAVNDLKTQQASYDEFNDSAQGKRSSKEMLESRQQGLINLSTRIKELDAMDDLTDEQKAERTRFKEGLETGTVRLRADQSARIHEEQQRAEAIQNANQKVWNVDPEQRATEVQRHVDSYATMLNRLDDARRIKSARTQAFDSRETQIQSRIDNPTSTEDAEAAKGELGRLTEARKYWDEFDNKTIKGTEDIANEVRRQITYYGTMNGLGEIGFEDELENRAATTRQAGIAAGTFIPADTSAVTSAIGNLNLTEPDPTIWQSMITGYDTVTGAASDAAVTISGGAGIIWGTGEGIVNAVVGLVDIVVIQSLDTYFEAMELYAEETTGMEIDIFGSENLDAINSAFDGSPSDIGDLALKFVIVQGGKVSNGLDRFESAYDTGSLNDAFSGTSDIAEVGAELFIDPTLVIGGLFKGVGILRAMNKVDDVARAANVVDDALRATNTVADTIGDGVRFGEAAHTPLTSNGAYQGLDELLGPEFANAFGEVPRAPVYPPARPTAIPSGGGRTPTAARAPVDGPYIGLDELLGPEFANAFDNVPGAGRLDGPTPYQGLDDLLGPEFANAFGEIPRAPVYPPVRPSRLSPAGSSPTPATPAAALDGPYMGLDELLGPEFANAFDNVPGASTLDGPTPYQGFDELMGPEFANAFGSTPKRPVYPPTRPSPLTSGGPRPSAAPRAPLDGPYQGLDELLGPEFRNALDDPFPVGRDGVGSNVPFDNPPGVRSSANPRGGGTSIPPTVRPGNTPPTVPSANRPAPSGPATNTPLTPGESGIAVSADDIAGAERVANDAIPPTVRPGNTPPTVPSANRPIPAPANSNVPLTPGESGIAVSADELVEASRLARAELDTIGRGGGAMPPRNPTTATGELSPSPTLRDELVQGSGRQVVIPDNPATPVTARRHVVNGREFTYLTDPTGKVHKLEKGVTLGKGTFTEVSTLRNQPTPSVVKEAVDAAEMARLTGDVDEAIRLAKIGDRLDAVGTDRLRELSTFVQENIVFTPEILGEFKVVANNVNPDLAGKSFRIAELAPGPTYADEMAALGKSWRTPMSVEQTNALRRAQNFITDSGVVVLDFKSNNFGFHRLKNGNLRVIIHDAGGVVPVRGATVAEKAANAKLLQRALLTPSEEAVGRYRQLLNEANNAHIDELSARAAGDDIAATLARDVKNAANNARAEISFAHRDNVLKEYGHLIDTDALRVPLDEIAFNPTIGFNQDALRASARYNMQRAANDNFAALGAAAGN